MAGLNNSLQLRTAQTQSLSMTPQLQQAIKLLQLSTLELIQEINQSVDLNPLLEIDEKQDDNMQSLDAMIEHDREDNDFDLFNDDSSINNNVDISINQEINDHNVLSFEGNNKINQAEQSIEHDFDTYQKDNYTQALSRSTKNYELDDNVFEGETSFSLQDHLNFQLDLSPLTGKDKYIAQNIIDGIDESGYLTEDLNDILQSVQQNYADTTLEDIQTILKLVQHYDPLGIGSRSVQECLLIQLHAKDQNDKTVKQAITIVENYLNLLSNKDFRSLCQKLSIKENELKKIVDLITSLNPRPGQGVIKEKSDFIIPDVLCYKDKNGEYIVELNNQALPKVKLNETYKAMMHKATTKTDVQFFKSHLQEANWFLQSLNKRNETLLKVSSCIIMHQKDFLIHGEEYMQPLILNDIAIETDLHESTISRITTQKYIHTPRGTYELKYFFSSKVNTESGGSASSTAIRAHIKNLIANENKRKPLSDSQLSKELEKIGIIAARRTVAKYREALGISSSSQRKLLV